MSKQVVVPLVGAEGDKCRRRKIPILVRGQVDWVEGQLSGDSLDICNFKVLQEIYAAEEKWYTKFLEDILNPVTVGFLEARFNQISAVGKKRPVIPCHSFELCVCRCCQQNIPILQIESGGQYEEELLCQSETCLF